MSFFTSVRRRVASLDGWARVQIAFAEAMEYQLGSAALAEPGALFKATCSKLLPELRWRSLARQLTKHVAHCTSSRHPHISDVSLRWCS